MQKKSKSALALSTAAYALIAVSATALTVGYSAYLAQPAYAAGNGGGGGGAGGGGAGGGGGDGAGAGNGGGGQGGNGAGAHGSGSETGGKGGPSADSEGKGPKAGAMGKNSTAGKPNWSKEGIPEVELGRLNVARSPAKVLDRQLKEALSTWNPANSTLYSLTAEQFAAYVKANWDSISIVDSPLQNLALLNALYDGTLNLSAINVTPASAIDLAAIFLGTASDKTVPISTNTAIAINTILGLGLNSAQLETLATKAEEVRQAILAAHG